MDLSVNITLCPEYELPPEATAPPPVRFLGVLSLFILASVCEPVCHFVCFLLVDQLIVLIVVGLRS